MCLTGLITVLISLCNMMILWVSACGTLKDMEQFSLCPTLLYCSYFILAVSIKCHTSPVSAEPHISVFSFCFVSDWMNLPEFLKNASENVVGLFCFNSDRTWRSLVVLYLQDVPGRSRLSYDFFFCIWSSLSKLRPSMILECPIKWFLKSRETPLTWVGGGRGLISKSY